MKGLLIKDLSYIKQSKLLQTAVLITLIFAFAGGNMVTTYLAVMSASMLQTTFTYDEYKGGMKYILTLPVTRKQYVQSKFLLAGLLGMIGTIFGIVVNAGVSLIKGNSMFEVLDIAILFAGVMVIVLLLTAIYIPLLLKFGIERGRLMAFLVLIILAATIAIGAIVLIDVLDRVTSGPEAAILFGVPILVIAAVFAGSYFISLRIMEKKEW